MTNGKKENTQTLALFDDRERGRVVEFPCIILESAISVSSVVDLCLEIDTTFPMDGNQYGAKTTRGGFFYNSFDYDVDTVRQNEFWPNENSEEIVHFILIGDVKGFWPVTYIVNSLDWRNDLKTNSVPK